MIYLILPRGGHYGWGVVGKYFVKELSDITEIKYITESFTAKDIGDDLDFYFLRSKLIDGPEAQKIKNGTLKQVDYPILQLIDNETFQPAFGVNLKGTFNAGYIVFESNIFSDENIQNLRNNYDIVITSSKWCEHALRNHGLEKVVTVVQGIDPQTFNPYYSDKELFKDRFVIFSGGKFEIRKGQDVAIKAYKVLQDKHQDVLLVNSWYNFWPDSMVSMAASPHIKFEIKSNDFVTNINKNLQDNGIDLGRVITLPVHSNASMSRIYKNTDVGLFPNRCEGGTNLVLMEYMACGKPVIASFSSGHKDIINESNSIMIKNMSTINITDTSGTKTAVWDDPDLDETIGHLEWAYHHREELRTIGLQAGKDLKQFTWKISAEKLLKIIEKQETFTL